ncbi:hypothetical protein M011DRAFT_470390 [Sporormia fimetaria CBS 119925]|uniref:ASX DEUBAD domain-containing protein n=1 Tax=Sporormia fimetaria CBS 119925 TaxID=1340428 RepID=A0A6A6V3E0_9PLEO|nr:hypothetical protein M011DRAFT_470390 [Sporormia fimetaria CBS 119925]
MSTPQKDPEPTIASNQASATATPTRSRSPLSSVPSSVNSPAGAAVIPSFSMPPTDAAIIPPSSMPLADAAVAPSSSMHPPDAAVVPSSSMPPADAAAMPSFTTPPVDAAVSTSSVMLPADAVATTESSTLAPSSNGSNTKKKLAPKAKNRKVTQASKKRPLDDLSNAADVEPATPSKRTRPSRTRKTPARLAEEETKPAPKKAAAPRTPASKVFDPVYITTNANSRLGKADVYHMLLEASAWETLDGEQRATILKLLPPTRDNVAALSGVAEGNLPARPKELSGEIFCTDVAKFQEDLRNGYLAKTWQAKAEQAMKDRAAGLFDEWKAEETETWWGENQQ